LKRWAGARVEKLHREARDAVRRLPMAESGRTRIGSFVERLLSTTEAKVHNHS
jgi:hypothetical protein